VCVIKGEEDGQAIDVTRKESECARWVREVCGERGDGEQKIEKQKARHSQKRLQRLCAARAIEDAVLRGVIACERALARFSEHGLGV
jgi:hypothetical protein